MTATKYGFAWGPMVVSRLTEVEWRKGRGPQRVLGVKTNTRRLEVYVSPTGRVVRAYLDGRELT